MTDHPLILLVEDDASIRKFIRISLEAHEYRVLEARRGGDGLELCRAEDPTVIILDLGLPDMDGMEVISRLREWSDVPIIVLSVRAAEEQKVAALDLGANDYVTKPFGIGELMARVRALLRDRSGNQASIDSVFDHAGLRVDLQAREVSIDGEPVRLTRKEYELLHLLVSNPGRVLSHEQLLDQIWGQSHSGETHYLRVLMRQLRKKLHEDAASPRFLLTVQGVGYRLDIPAENE